MYKVFVTGNGRGIGRVIASTFDAAGMVVSGTHTKDSRVNVCDDGAIAKRISDFSPDILVNNAGVTDDALTHKMSYEQWCAVLGTNLTGSFSCIHAALPGMRTRGWGRIINIVSVVAHTGCYGAPNYAASKSGLIGLTKSVALENASKGITCNAVALGFMGAGMCERLPDAVKQKVLSQIAMGRFGTPEDAADAVLFLASARAAYITGEVLNVNGGYYL